MVQPESTPRTGRAVPGGVVTVRATAALADEIALRLTGSLNLRRTALRLLDLIKPGLADWAMLAIPDSRTGGLMLFGGEEPGYSVLVPRPAANDLGLGRVLRTGQTELLHVAVGIEADDDGLTSLIPHLDLSAQVASRLPVDVLAVALTAGGSTLAALVVVRGGGYDDGDVAIAQRIADRAAIALDSARLYEERGLLAAALQEAVRPPVLPDVDGLLPVSYTHLTLPTTPYV